MTQWIDEIEWNNLNPEEVVDLLKQNNANLSEVTQVIDKLSVAGTNSNTTIFYSGLVDTKAFVEGHKQAGTRIIDTTKAGKIIGDTTFQDYLKETFKNENISSFLYDGKDGLWARTSKRFAEATAGEIDVKLGPNLRRNSVFIQTELPVIIENVNIHTANGLPKENFLKGLFGGDGLYVGSCYRQACGKNFERCNAFIFIPNFAKNIEQIRDGGYCSGADNGSFYGKGGGRRRRYGRSDRNCFRFLRVRIFGGCGRCLVGFCGD